MDFPNKKDAGTMSGPMSMSRSSLMMTDDLLLKSLPPRSLAVLQNSHRQKAKGYDVAAAVPKKVTFTGPHACKSTRKSYPNLCSLQAAPSACRCRQDQT